MNTLQKVVIRAVLVLWLVSGLLISNELFAQTCTGAVSGTSDWTDLSWTCAGGGSAPLTDGGSYNEAVIVDGIGTGEIVYVDISVTISGTKNLTINANGSTPTLWIRAGKTLRVTGNLINSNNNVRFYVEAGAFLIVDGTLNGNQNNLFGGPGTISGGTLNLGNNAGCMGGDCPTINFPNCTAGGTFCADNNSACLKTNTISGATTICTGASVNLTATTPTAGSGSYSYLWESSTTSASTGFAAAAGTNNVNTPYSTGVLTQTTWYRRVVTDIGATPACQQPNTSNVIQVTVNPAVSISSHPSATTVCNGAGAGFSVTAAGTALTYQWQINTSGTWSNLSNVAPYSGVTTASLAISAVTSSMSGYQYRVNVSGGCGAPLNSNAATLTVTSSGTWLGTTSTSWTTASNWCGGVPTSTTDVIINSGTTFAPSITAAGAVCRNLTINSGTLTITSPGALSVKGTLTNNGTFTGTGKITLDGISTQSISGSGTFRNLELKNSTGGTISGAVTISGYLSLTTGVLNTGGNLKINLDAGGIDWAATHTGSTSGSVTFLKTVPSYKYHYISSPLLSGVNFTQFSDNAPIVVSGGYSNLYYYNEAIVNTDKLVGWTTVGSTSDPIVAMKGYAMYFYSSVVLDVTGTYTHGSAPSNVSLTNTVSATPGSDGWHLIGNPFPSTINWDASSGWTKTNIGNAIYFWDPANDRYATYVDNVGTNGGTANIPSMQAFWVKVSVSGGTGTLGMTNAVRIPTATTPSLWRVAATNNTLRLKVKSDQTPDDETVIRFRGDAETTFDYGIDAFKMKNSGNTPSLYTKLENEDYSINNVSNQIDEITIPLHLKTGLAGTYAIESDNIQDFDPSYDVFIEDRLTNTVHELRDGQPYTFASDPADTTGRFLITFRQTSVTSVGNKAKVSKVLIRGNEKTVHIDFANNLSDRCTIDVYDIMGNEISEIRDSDISSGKYSFEVPNADGIYLLKVSIDGEVFTGKVYLK